MANNLKADVLGGLTARFGKVEKLGGSQSLFDVGDGALRVYFRYSKVHSGSRAFYGLRKDDLAKLEGHNSVLCFLWDDQEEPMFLLYEDYEEVFRNFSPASDGQFKVQIQFSKTGTELYVARAGRFKVDGDFGWETLEGHVDASKLSGKVDLSHYQIQTLLGSIGASKNFDIWIPASDRARLDNLIAPRFECCNTLPNSMLAVQPILSEVDVVWIQRGSNQIRAMFEVEHSTPVYSGLLRFNDVHLTDAKLKPSFTIVANDARRALFSRQLARPTFVASGLNELCAFMRYENVVAWHKRAASTPAGSEH